MPPQPLYYVYVKYKPDGIPFYVGKGKDNRAYSLAGRSNAFQALIKTYKDEVKTNLYFFATAAQALAAERRFIRKYRSQGIDLCNRTKGGERGRPPHKLFTKTWVRKVYTSSVRKRAPRKLKTISLAEVLTLLNRHLGEPKSRNILSHRRKHYGFPDPVPIGRPRQWRKDLVMVWINAAKKERRRG
jgi:hypothetical protein